MTSAAKDIRKELRREIRKGYTNQDIWKLIDLANKAAIIGQTEPDPAMTGIGIEAIRYSLILKDWRKSGGKSLDIPIVKTQAKWLLRAIQDSDAQNQIQESRRRAAEHL